MEQNPYEAPREATNPKRQLPLYEQLVAFPGWGRVGLLALIVSVLTAIFLIGLLCMLMETPL